MAPVGRLGRLICEATGCIAGMLPSAFVEAASILPPPPLLLLLSVLVVVVVVVLEAAVDGI
jgi:hypothetical protein